MLLGDKKRKMSVITGVIGNGDELSKFVFIISNNVIYANNIYDLSLDYFFFLFFIAFMSIL
jgi:hypothetical protein